MAAPMKIAVSSGLMIQLLRTVLPRCWRITAMGRPKTLTRV